MTVDSMCSLLAMLLLSLLLQASTRHLWHVQATAGSYNCAAAAAATVRFCPLTPSLASPLLLLTPLLLLLLHNIR
jgi:hypothetical protein